LAVLKCTRRCYYIWFLYTGLPENLWQCV